MMRPMVTSDDERDAEEIFGGMHSVVTSTPKQPLNENATASCIMQSVKENRDPMSRLREESMKGKLPMDDRKRILQDVEENADQTQNLVSSHWLG